eukprot:7794597-Pyramimonas_sp.AAC.1
MAPSLRGILAAALGGHARTLPAIPEEEGKGHFARQLPSPVNPTFSLQRSCGVGVGSHVALLGLLGVPGRLLEGVA